MSKISEVYDGLVAALSALFPEKSRMMNPYELAENGELMLKNAYGLKLLSAQNVVEDLNSLSTSRNFSAIFVRQFITIGSKSTSFDEVTKALLEDQQNFMARIYSTDRLGIPGKIDRVEISDVTGIEFVADKEKKYLFCELQFTITTSEQV